MDMRRSSRSQRDSVKEDEGIDLSNIDPTNFSERIRSEGDAIKLAEQFQLLPKRGDLDVNCKCGKSFVCRKENRARLGWQWYCADCNTTLSPLTDTIFSDMKFSIRDVMKLILCFVADCSRKQMVRFVKKDEKTITSWNRKIRRAMSVKNSNDFTKFDGDVEIDETCVCRNKYGVGSLLASQARNLWVLGFIERNSKKRFMTRVYNRSIPYVDGVMMSVLGDGCLILTDKFQTYKKFLKRNPELISRGHKSVNHKRNFVDPSDKDVHTQHIESLWKQAKKAIKSFQSLDLIDEYLAEYQYRCNNFKEEHYSYEFNYTVLLKDLAAVYAPRGYERMSGVDIVDSHLKNGFPDDVKRAMENEEKKSFQQDFFANGEIKKPNTELDEKAELMKELDDCLSEDDRPLVSDNAWREAHIQLFIDENNVVRYSRREDLGLNVYVNKDTILEVMGKNEGRHKGWLTDEAINAYMELIKVTYSREDRRIAIVSTHFFTALRAGNTEIIRHMKEDDMLNATIILIPIFEGVSNQDGHWYLGVVNHSKETKEIAFYNSLCWRHSEQMKVLRSYIEQLHSSRGLPQIDEYRFRSSLSSNEVPKQQTSNDCGIFTLLFARKIAQGETITGKCINPLNIPRHRIDIAYELIKKQIFQSKM